MNTCPWKSQFPNILQPTELDCTLLGCTLLGWFSLGWFSLAICLPSAFVVVSVASFAGAADQDNVEQVVVQRQAGKLQVRIGDALFTEYRYAGYAKPILYPIYGPHEIAMTRNYPMQDVAGEAHDHPHQKSMWFTHGLVNGVDFWSEGAGRGTVVQDRLIQTCSGEGQAQIKTANRWLDSRGTVVCTDTRLLTFSALEGGARAIDWRVTIHASAGKVVFGDTKEGMMGIRTNPQLRLKNDPKHGVTSAVGHSVNSAGQQGNEAWGQPAEWVDYWAKIDGQTVGVALFDHPKNPRHPSRWHARDYGLIAANPFGLHHFADQPEGSGDMTISSGKSVTFRYRILFHQGNTRQADIPARYQQYAGTGGE
jgi:hypothetical protein